MYIPWGKTLSSLPKPWSSVKVKVKLQGRSFRKKMAVAGTLVFHKHSLVLSLLLLLFVTFRPTITEGKGEIIPR